MPLLTELGIVYAFPGYKDATPTGLLSGLRPTEDLDLAG
jgi:hypothetical protein